MRCSPSLRIRGIIKVSERQLMVRAIEGTYRDGKVELDELPKDVGSARVYELFVPQQTQPEQPDERRQHAMNDFLKHMKTGYALGGPPYPTRDEIYDRGQGK